MKRFFIFMAIMFGMIAPSLLAQTTTSTPENKVAVYVSHLYVEKHDNVRNSLVSTLVSSITRSQYFTVVERNAAFIAELDKEFAETVGDDAKDDQIAKLGQQYGVKYVLVADISYMNEETFISARMIDVETARMINVTEVSGYVESMEGLTRLADAIIAGLIDGARIANSGLSSTNHTVSQSDRDFVETALGLNMKMVWVEGGEFMMGATSEQDSEAYEDEEVMRRVRLNSFYIGESEITQAQWERVMGTSIYQQASERAVYGVGPDYPMYYVSWEEAQAFCQELSRITGRTYCLPTEAQWEYAARGGKNAEGTKYSGSWSIDAVMWFEGNSGLTNHPVKYKKANALGLYDMSGSVSEWCADWYSSSYNMNDTNNPTGPSSGSCRVRRGGSCVEVARDCRVSARYGTTPGSRYGNVGFRVALLP